MMIRLGQAQDGRLVLGSSEEFPADILHVEYYRDQRLFNLVFDTPDQQNALMPCELSEKTAAIVHTSPNIIVVAMIEQGSQPCGYSVPLIQIGV